MPQSTFKLYHSSAETARSAAALAMPVQPPKPMITETFQSTSRLGLASVAAAMAVPVVIATFRDEFNVKTLATYGLNLMNNIACFAAVCDELCDEHVLVIPDTRKNAKMSAIQRHWPGDHNCFLVGIPLRDACGKRAGSLCVMNSSRTVARMGISFQTLSEIGRAFSQTGRLSIGYAQV